MESKRKQIYDYKDLENKVTFWANERNLLHKENAFKQFVKFVEESGELAESVLKGTDCTDDFGDVMVTLIILSKQLNYDLLTCLEYAIAEIIDREGKTINGVFVKSSNLPKEGNDD